jgi:DNA-binding SARP family transcriptional activator/tetratricopeptide (TPR) repeat protein
MDNVRFALLGELRVRLPTGEWSHVPGQMPRTLLAELLLSANSPVPADRLGAVLWGANPPGSAQAALYNHVMRLRRLLPGGRNQRLRTVSPGYLLQVAPGELDTHVFDELSARGMRALGTGGWQQAADDLGAALSLWRGPALADVPRLAEDTRLQHLAEARTRGLQARIEADIALGRHADVIGELRTLICEHPLREEFYILLMTALYRANRQGEALDVYQALRRVLVGDLGVEPCPAVRELHQRILATDPGLLHTGPQEPAQPGSAPRTAAARCPSRHQLPTSTRLFTGRTAEAGHLLDLARSAANTPCLLTATIDGMPGVGKTALAIQVAHAARQYFPDGQFFLDLHGYADGLEPMSAAGALERLLRSLGVPAASIPTDSDERAALYRDRLDGTKSLILLDNARGAAQVRPLIPGGQGCLVLVTSRNRLTGLDDAHTITLDVPGEADAISLIHAIAGPGRLPAGHPAVAVLAGLCGRLPLAMGIVAARLHHHPLIEIEDVVAELRDHASRLENLRDGDRSVTAALRTSVDALDANQRRVFRLLGHVPGPDFDTRAAAAMTRTTPRAAGRLLESLSCENLLIQHAAGRYRLHDLVRSYAQGLAQEGAADDTGHAVDGLLDHYLAFARRADASLARVTRPGAPPEPGELADPVEWVRMERENILAAIEQAASLGQARRVVELTASIAAYLHRESATGHSAALHARAAEAARELADRLAEANALSDLGRVQLVAGDHARARRNHGRALVLYRAVGNALGEANTLNDLGRIEHMSGNYPAETDLFAQSLALYQAVGDQLGIGNIHIEVARLGLIQGRYLAAIERCTAAVEIFGRIGREDSHAIATDTLARAHRLLGHTVQAETLLNQSLDTHTRLGSLMGQATTLLDLGRLYFDTGRIRGCIQLMGRSLRWFGQLGSPAGQANALQMLALAHRVTGDYATAAVFHTEALEIFTGIGDRLGEANELHNLGLVLFANGDIAAAAGLHRQSLTRYREIGDRLGRANAMHHLGRTLLAEGNTVDAMSHFRQALEDAQELGVDQVAAEILVSMGTLIAQTGHPEEALGYHRRAAALAGKTDSPLEAARALHAAALCAEQAGQMATAVADLRAAATLFQRIGAAETTAALTKLASLQAAAGTPPAALRSS